MTVIRKDKDKTISIRNGSIVVRKTEKKKSAAEELDLKLKKAAKKIDDALSK